MKNPAEINIPVRSEMELVTCEPDYDIVMNNQIEPDDMTKSELETGVHVKSEPETVWVKSEPADVWMEKEPEAVVWIKSEPEADNQHNMEFKTEFEIGCEIKAGNFVVRIVIAILLKFS